MDCSKDSMESLDPEELGRPTVGEGFRPEPFRQRVYGVTGAGQRIGEAIALALGQLEARLILVDVNEQTLSRVAQTLEGQGVDVRCVVGDVAHRETTDGAIDVAMQAWGHVDGWVNNVGINLRANLADQSDADVEYVWQVNVDAARRAIQRLAPIMKEQGRGGIINVSSILAHQTRPWDATYAGTKGAIEAMTRAWALELAPAGVRVNCLRPGAVELVDAEHLDFGTGELGTLRRRAYELRARAGEPRQQPTLPREVANAAVFLLSDMAAAITGAVLPVDGGTGVEFGGMGGSRERREARRELWQVRERIRELEAEQGISPEVQGIE